MSNTPSRYDFLLAAIRTLKAAASPRWWQCLKSLETAAFHCNLASRSMPGRETAPAQAKLQKLADQISEISRNHAAEIWSVTSRLDRACFAAWTWTPFSDSESIRSLDPDAMAKGISNSIEAVERVLAGEDEPDEGTSDDADRVSTVVDRHAAARAIAIWSARLGHLVYLAHCSGKPSLPDPDGFALMMRDDIRSEFSLLTDLRQQGWFCDCVGRANYSLGDVRIRLERSKELAMTLVALFTHDDRYWSRDIEDWGIDSTRGQVEEIAEASSWFKGMSDSLMP